MFSSILPVRSARAARRLAALRVSIETIRRTLDDYAKGRNGVFRIAGGDVTTEAGFAGNFRICAEFERADERQAAQYFARQICVANGVNPEFVA